jgi:hypothetical protein
MWWGNIEMFFDDVFVNANFSAAVTLTLTLQFFQSEPPLLPSYFLPSYFLPQPRLSRDTSKRNFAV